MWLGIPFAKPPVGELRFKRARKPEPWDGVLKCQEMGPGPIQFAAGSMKMMTDQKYRKNEDCLYLNIKAPENARMAPIFVWIYGGANSIGEASAPEYLADAFPRDGVIGGSFNYRVGPLGFYVDYMKCTLAKAERETVYTFRFDFEPFLARIAGLHATHGMDICCGLDTWSGKMYLPNLLTSKKRLQAIHKVMHGAFVDFCKAGIPDLHMDEKWKPYIPEKPYTFIFNDICSHTNSTNWINYEVWKDIELYNQK